MAKLVECIPNFSVSKEKDEPVFQGLVDVAKAAPGCTLMDVQSDGNHNRCVFTLVELGFIFSLGFSIMSILSSFF